MRLIDADAYAAEMKTRQDACRELIYAAEAECNEEMYDRNSAKFGIFVEAKLTLDAMPTIDAIPLYFIKDRIEVFKAVPLPACVDTLELLISQWNVVNGANTDRKEQSNESND